MRNATIRRVLPFVGLAAKPRFVAAAAALLATAAMGGTALAASHYTVKLSVPKTVQNSSFTVKATGTAASSSQVVAYIGNKACASTPNAEKAQAGARRVLNKSVNHTYTASKAARAGSAGSHRVCAYLTSTNGSTVRARTSATYTALAGAY